MVDRGGRKGAWLVGGMLLAIVALSGCSQSNLAQDDRGRYVIHMGAAEFLPASAHVPLNATVVWVNDSPVAHDVQGGSAFSSGPFGGIAPGGDYAFTFKERGTYEYFCFLHHGSGMIATVTVG